MHNSTTRGVLFSAFSNPAYAHEAATAAQSVRQQMPDIPIALVTDLPDEIKDTSRFDLVHVLEDEHGDLPAHRVGFFKKIVALAQTPFDTTIFLDGDTRCCYPLHDLFGMLQNVDIAAALAPTRGFIDFSVDDNARRASFGNSGNILPGLNTGVVGYRRTSDFLKFVEVWGQIFRQRVDTNDPTYSDQTVFRQALVSSGISSWMLSAEYNVRVSTFLHIDGPVRVLHGRPEMGLEPFERCYNSVLCPRIALAGLGLLYIRNGMVQHRPLDDPANEVVWTVAQFVDLLRSDGR